MSPHNRGAITHFDFPKVFRVFQGGKVCMTKQQSRPNICVVGCGDWGKNLIRNFHSLGHLHSLFEANPARLDSFAVQYPAARIYRNWKDVLEEPELDAVVIATPAETHCDLAT